MRNIVYFLFIIFFFTSCTKTRYLSNDEVDFMPYKSGDYLVLVNRTNEKVDTVFIDQINRYVPDGPMIYFNETISALDKNGRQIMRISAGYGKFSEPYLSIKGLEGRHSLKEINKKPIIDFETQKLIFNDVVILEFKNKQSTNNRVSRVYWSKSKGIVQFDDSENETWQIIYLKTSKPK